MRHRLVIERRTHSDALQVTQSEVNSTCTPVMRFVVLGTEYEEHQQRNAVVLSLSGRHCQGLVILRYTEGVSYTADEE